MTLPEGVKFPPIKEKWLELKRKSIKQFPQNNLRASSLGFPCDRYHYHSIKNWKERPLHDEIQQSIFDEGNFHETRMIQELQDSGLVVVEQQRALQIDKPLITGHIDGVLRYEGRDFPFDVKTVSFDDGSESMEDMLYSKKLWVRSYPGQLQLYLLMTNQEYGCFIMKEKTTGEPKIIWGAIDYDYCELLLKRAERVYKAIEANEPPAKINDFNVCENCSFRHVCLPDISFGEGVILMENKAVLDVLNRWSEIKEIGQEWSRLDDEIKKAAKAPQKAGEFLIGDFIIKVSSFSRKGYTVADSEGFKAQIVKLK